MANAANNSSKLTDVQPIKSSIGTEIQSLKLQQIPIQKANKEDQIPNLNFKPAAYWSFQKRKDWLNPKFESQIHSFSNESKPQKFKSKSNQWIWIHSSNSEEGDKKELVKIEILKR